MSKCIIQLPGLHDIDITPIKPIVDSPQFQRLRNVRQLGMLNLIFPSANHTRFEHSLGTYALALERARLWYKARLINQGKIQAIALHGLLHDIGHGPYSHESEPLCKLDHNENGLSVIEGLKSEIEKCGCDFVELRRMLNRQDSTCEAVCHHPLGADKLDYIIRDSRATNEAVNLPLGALLNYSHFNDDRLVIDERIESEARHAQHAYIYMYYRIYLRKSSLILKRMVTKMIGALMQPEEENCLTENALWKADDGEINTRIASSTHRTAQLLRMMLLTRQLPKLAISLRPAGCGRHEHVSNKAIAVHELAVETFNQLEWLEQVAACDRLESKIATQLGIPSAGVLVIPTISLKRFQLPDIPVYTGGSVQSSLRQLAPAHYQGASEQASAYTAIRICVPNDYRRHVAQPAIARQVVNTLLQDTSLA